MTQGMSSVPPPAPAPAKRACLACRAKKSKCVPGPRRCMRCTDMGIEDCVYEQVKKRGIGKTLRMGEACACCRVKKKKCDAKRPCTACIIAKTVTECVYDDGKRPKPGQRSKGTDPVDVPTATHYHSSSGSAFAHVALLTELDPAPFMPSDATWAVTNEPAAQQIFGADRVPHGELVLARRNQLEQRVSPDTSPSIFAVPSFSSTITPEPWIPLSFLGGEKLQVQISDAATTELVMKSRLWYLARLPKLGIQFSRNKVDALIRGDKSGTVMHRSFVCMAETLGITVFMGVTPAMVQFHAKEIKASREALSELLKGNDYRAKIHGASSAIPGFIYLRLPQAALPCIQKCCESAQAGNLQFVPTYGRPPEFSEDFHEISVALSQTIYWANYLFLVCGGPEPHATAKFEKEFRHELPRAYPVLFEICPLTMRTKGILLVKDTILLLGAAPADDVQFGLWRQSCHQVLPSLDLFSLSMLSNIKRFRNLGDKTGAEVITSICITCLAHLAILYEVVCRVDPMSGSKLYDLCDSALRRLGALTSEVHFDDYTRLDLLLGDSWSKSLPVFDARIASLPPEESASLLYCRKVVGVKYSDFQTKVPDCKPPIIVSSALATLEDGSTKDPRYPNLLSPGVGMQYRV